jgi:hypothetical protein
MAKSFAGVRSPALSKFTADLTQSQRIAAAGLTDQMAKSFAGVRSPALSKAIAAAASGDLSWLAGGVPLDGWLTGVGADELAEDHLEPEVRTESGLIIPSPTETLIFGGFQFDDERAFFALVFTGLLLPVIMAPQLEPIREYASWAVWLYPAIYHALGRLPKR